MGRLHLVTALVPGQRASGREVDGDAKGCRMAAGSTRRSRVARPDPGWTRWLVALLILYASCVAAALMNGLGGSGPISMSVGIATVVGGGALGACALRPRLSRRGVVGTVVLPLPVAFAAWLIMVPFAEGGPEVDLIALRLYVIWELSIVLTAAVIALARRRTGQRVTDAGWELAELDVATATDLGRAETVLREYPDTPWGRSMLRAERRRFAARDYVLVELESRGGAADGAAELELLLPVPLIGLDTTSEPTIIATFKNDGPR